MKGMDGRLERLQERMEEVFGRLEERIGGVERRAREFAGRVERVRGEGVQRIRENSANATTLLAPALYPPALSVANGEADIAEQVRRLRFLDRTQLLPQDIRLLPEEDTNTTPSIDIISMPAPPGIIIEREEQNEKESNLGPQGNELPLLTQSLPRMYPILDELADLVKDIQHHHQVLAAATSATKAEHLYGLRAATTSTAGGLITGKRLGDIPSNLPSIGSLLVFESLEIPFSHSLSLAEEKKNESGDDQTLKTAESTKQAPKLPESRQRKLSEAPKTLSAAATAETNEEMTTTNYDVGFKPKLKQMKEFALPSNLDLPDIANVASFVSSSPPDERPAFTSSAATNKRKFSAPPSAPSPPALAEETQEPGRSSSVSTTSLLSMQPLPRALTASPIFQETATESGNEGERNISAPKNATTPPGNDARQSLLQAIRGDPMKQLRKVEAERDEALPGEIKQESPNKKAKKPLSLADEMRQKLARRQKALSGALDEEEQQVQANRRSLLNSAMPSESSETGGQRVKNNDNFTTAENDVSILTHQRKRKLSTKQLTPSPSGSTAIQDEKSDGTEAAKSLPSFSLNRMSGLQALLDAKNSAQQKKKEADDWDDD